MKMLIWDFIHVALPDQRKVTSCHTGRVSHQAGGDTLISSINTQSTLNIQNISSKTSQQFEQYEIILLLFQIFLSIIERTAVLFC